MKYQTNRAFLILWTLICSFSIVIVMSYFNASQTETIYINNTEYINVTVYKNLTVEKEVIKIVTKDKVCPKPPVCIQKYKMDYVSRLLRDVNTCRSDRDLMNSSTLVSDYLNMNISLIRCRDTVDRMKNFSYY